MIKYISLDQNILQAAIDEIDRENCLLLFPTRKSKKKTQKLFQQRWDFRIQHFHTMDEMKDSLLLTDKPILKEDKRKLALYQAVSRDSKEFFKINNYSQFINFAVEFFNFWEEMIEEQISELMIAEVLKQKQSAQNWQLDTFQHLVTIKEDYNNFLSKREFSDEIFIDKNMTEFMKYEKIIVVNQFYFTGFEKQFLQTNQDKAVILMQMPSECFDEENLTVKDFTATHLKGSISSTIKINTTSEQMEMITQLIRTLSPDEHIIDFQFQNQPYADLFSPHKFHVSTQVSISSSCVYQFFQNIYNIIKSINKKPFLYSIQSLLDAFLDNNFLYYFQIEKKEEIRSFLFNLIDREYKFIDFDLLKETDFAPEMEKIFSFIQKYYQIDNLSQLTSLIKNVDHEKVFGREMKNSNIVEIFYNALADFNSLDEIGLVTNWKQIFPSHTAKELLKLWLDYLKAKRFSYNTDLPSKRISISSLQNTRNLNFKKVSILNVVEGILPDSKHTQFLLSENQRKKLGLKTHDDIILRDKYYFYRLLTSSEQVTVFTMKDLEENIEVSSFLAELDLAGLVKKSKLEKEQENEKFDNRSIYSQFFKETLETKEIEKSDKITADFFTFKSKFPKEDLHLSFYKWNKLSGNPFEYFLEIIKDLHPKTPEIENDFTPKLIGLIVHNVINNIFKRINSLYTSKKIKHNFIYNTKQYVKQALQNYLKLNKKLRYTSPRNFSHQYFEKIFLPVLSDGIENFFYRLHNDFKLSDIPIVLIPETESNKDTMFFENKGKKIHLVGRPDLRIDTKNAKYIFDFKTGGLYKHKKYFQQLQFYQNIYYPEDLDANLHLFYVLHKEIFTSNKSIDLKEMITTLMENILEKGFYLPQKSADYENEDITRRDLLLKLESS